MLLALLSLLIPAMLGFAMVRLIWPIEWTSWALVLLQVSLSGIVGAGVASCLAFVWLLIWNSFAGYPLAETILALVLLLSLRRRGLPALPSLKFPDHAGTQIELWIRLLSAVTIVLGLSALLVSSYVAPYGAYDAWAIWNIHARFLFRSAEHWQDLLLPGSSAHPDYPLLIPALVARSWSYAGVELVQIPAAWSVLFTLAASGLLFAALTLLLGVTEAGLATALLLGTSHFIYNGTAQISDVPLSAYVLAAVVLLHLYSGLSQSQPRALVLSGMCVALAAWTKNEGLLFVVVVASALVGACLWLRRADLLPLYLRRGLGGALPVLIVVIYFKLALAPSNDLVAGQRDGSLLRSLLEPGRYAQVGAAYVRWFLTFGRGSLVVLALYLVLDWRRLGVPKTVDGLAGVLIVLAMFAGYFLIFLATPHDLAWHLASLERLVVQFWPLLVFVAFMLRRTAPFGLAVPEQKPLQPERAA